MSYNHASYKYYIHISYKEYMASYNVYTTFLSMDKRRYRTFVKYMW